MSEWSGGPPGCSGVVGRSSWMSGSGREALPKVREWLVVVSSSGTTLPYIQEWLRSPPRYPRVVGRPSRMSGNGR